MSVLITSCTVDSFESSCTSSGECYENTGTNAQDPCSQDSDECYENTEENRERQVLKIPSFSFSFKKSEELSNIIQARVLLYLCRLFCCTHAMQVMLVWLLYIYIYILYIYIYICVCVCVCVCVLWSSIVCE